MKPSSHVPTVKAAVMNSLTSKSGQRTYDRTITDFVVAGVMGTGSPGPFLTTRSCSRFVHFRLISPANPFELLTVHATNADLLVASRQLFLGLILLYGSS